MKDKTNQLHVLDVKIAPLTADRPMPSAYNSAKRDVRFRHGN